MLFVHLKGDKEKAISPRTEEWHVFGPALKIAGYEIDRVSYVQADEDELNHILMAFGTSIPVHNDDRIQAWYGDIAKSIVFSLLK